MTPRNRPLFTALLASPLLFAFGLRGDAPAFHPEAGTSVDKELSLTVAMYIDDLLLSLDGEEMPAEVLGEVLDTALEVEVIQGMTDQFVKSGRGRPLVLLRTFNEYSATASVGGEAQESDEMDLVGSTVKFAWNAEEEEYDITLEDGGVDEEGITNLDVDMDFIFLLPADEVKEGATWEVSGMDAAKLFLPGGIYGGLDEDLEEASEFGEMAKDLLVPQMEDALEDFVVECTYMGEDDDGSAQIEIEYEGELSLDLSELIMAVMDSSIRDDLGGADFDAEITLTMDFEVEGRGALTWDNEAGHALAFEMANEIIVLVDGEADIEVGGESHTAEATVEFSGEMEYEMSVD